MDRLTRVQIQKGVADLAPPFFMVEEKSSKQISLRTVAQTRSFFTEFSLSWLEATPTGTRDSSTFVAAAFCHGEEKR